MLIQLISEGPLKPPRGSFKHKLNFNCFVPQISQSATVLDTGETVGFFISLAALALV